MNTQDRRRCDGSDLAEGSFHCFLFGACMGTALKHFDFRTGENVSNMWLVSDYVPVRCGSVIDGIVQIFHRRRNLASQH